jgi:RHS repeat-associated protein
MNIRRQRSSLFSMLFRSGFIALLLLSAAVQSAHAARKTTYYHADGLGSVVAASNDAGALLWRKEYAPFGEQLDSTTEQEKLAYSGKEHDDVTGLTYFGARYYDPHLGQFMGIDPAGFVEANPMSFNRYAYGNANPYRFIDPDGREVYDVAADVLRKTFGYGTSGKGHHWVPFGSTNGPDMDISNDARLVFGQSVSGEKLPDQDHLVGHPKYTEAVRDELKVYANRNGIKLADMTKDEAEAFVRHIQTVERPDIRNLNARVIRFTEKSLSFKGSAAKAILRGAAKLGLVEYASETISTETTACRATNCAGLE